MSRIALVSPYSWTYPGGVTRHIESLAEELLARGHHVRVLSPYDPPDRMSALLHRGAEPELRPVPDHLIPLGRTVGIPMNGAVSNVALTPYSITNMRRELAAGRFDVVHVHEPNAAVPVWDAMLSADAPLVGTFHCYSENRVSNNLANLVGVRRRYNRLRVRIAVSEAAAWTGRRFYGGRYRVIPNGVDLDPELGDRATPAEPDAPLRIVFVGQAVERKGLPVLLRAYEALREFVPATLEVVGADWDEVAPLLLDECGVRAVGKVSDADKRAALRQADVLCAPSLGGESFGMVLTEAFASGTPVVASDIAGYRDVVRDGVDGMLVPRGDATELAEVLRDLWLEPERRARMAAAAAERAQRFAWTRVAEEVLETYAEAQAVPEPPSRLRRAAVRHGLAPSDGHPREPARRLPSLQPTAPGGRRPAVTMLRRGAMALAALAGLMLAALALDRIGLRSIGHALFYSSPAWVLAGLALMCSSMVLRALAWYSILRAALPRANVRRRDAMQGTFIGVLMSATLPARLGEPARAMIVARRIGPARDQLPVVLGTIVSQTLLNLVALAGLGAVMFSTVELFAGHEEALVAASLAPIAAVIAVLVAPVLLRRGPAGRSARLHAAVVRTRGAMQRVRLGLRVFRSPRRGALAAAAQLTAWVIQWLACYVLLVALGLDDVAGLGAAAAVLFAVNVTAALPLTPSNLGVFQAACVAVLAGAYHVNAADALGYGIILQAVEIATAVVMGMPALLKEGLSWRDVRMRALHSTPVRLPARPRRDRRARERIEAGA
ncbi:MAG: phosphatidyl-myo-inositol alpha-mannosyltransferase [Solirubrobacteraceae bacterium]|nr:phosphatidyl-myo-inositol alpha-mannosyltransferase [Solirubrobacteraceae bacterium]